VATILDDLSGFEFEEVMVEVFRHQGYRDVRRAVRTADEGRDVTIVDDSGPGDPVGVVVECKHTDVVGRPVIQKLHSAVQTYAYDGPRRGMVATTGRFTDPAEEYAERVSADPDDVDVDLLDGRRLREIGERIGMDLYSGRIEVLCEETLPPPRDAEAVRTVRDEAARPVANLDPDDLPEPTASLAFDPVLLVDAEVDATFETSVGVIHAVRERERLAVSADRDGPALLRDEAARLVDRGGDREAVPDRTAAGAGDGDEADGDEVDGGFDAVEIRRFGRTESEYVDWIVERQRERHERTVRYTGDNNVTYTKTCTPSARDVRVHGVDPVYLPRAASTTALGEYEYDHAFAANGDDRVTLVDEFGECVHCEAEGPGAGTGDTSGPITYCENCGSLSCEDHIREERLTGDPVCTGCSVTGEFFLATKHFYDEGNREAFAAEYDAMPVYRKPLENPRLAAALVGGALLVLAVLLVGAL
jgi:restriction endonuclease Mrr